MNKDDAMMNLWRFSLSEVKNVILTVKQIRMFWLRMQNLYIKKDTTSKNWFMFFPLLFRVLGWSGLERIGFDVL